MRIPLRRTKSIEHFIQVVEREAAFNQSLDALVGGANRLGNLVHVLGLDNCLEVVLEQFREVVYESVSSAVSHARLPLCPYSEARSHGNT